MSAERRRSVLAFCLVSVPLILGTLLSLVLISRNAEQQPLGRFDQSFYLSIAYDLDHHGVFSSGVFDEVDGSQERPPPGMFLTPLYPAVLWVFLQVDPGFADAVDCAVPHYAVDDVKSDCIAKADSVVLFHFLLWGGTVVLVWFAAWVIFESRRIAWTAAGLAYLASLIMVETARWVMTESLTIFLFGCTSLALVWALKHKSTAGFAASGLFLGLLTLTRPSFLYLMPFELICLLALSLVSRGDRRRQLIGAMALALAFALVVGPWMTRNWLVLDRFALTEGYGSLNFGSRIAYNAMSLREYGAAFVYWLPDFGNDLAEQLFDDADYLRLSRDRPDSYYLYGLNEFYEATLEAAGGPERHLSHLFEHYLLPDLGKHILVTLPFAWAGLWVAKYWGLVTFALFVPAVFRTAGRAEYLLLAYAVPAFYMLGLHAFVSINRPRYNLILILCFAVGAAWSLNALWNRAVSARRAAPPTRA